jgi:hypothetical protein
MDKNFDDLFNEFFRKRNNSINPFIEIGNMKEEIRKMMDMLMNFQNIPNIDENLEKQMDDSLGEPDKIETYSDGVVFYEKKIWHTPEGDIVKLVVSDKPFTNSPKGKKVVNQKLLQEQLEEALANEDYLKAAELRDKLNPPKKKRGRPKKSEKKSD